MDRIVLAYSGGPASSAAIPWLREEFQAEVVTVTVDLGQSEPLDGIRVRALGSGAARAHVLDRRDVFARHHLLPALQSGATDIDSPEALSTLARPLIAHALAEIAEIEGTRRVAHAERGDAAHDAIRSAVHLIDSSIEVIDVANRWALSPDDIAPYARERGIPIAPDAAPNAANDPLPATRSGAPPVQVTIDFRIGVPVRINGVEMDLVELFTSLDTIAAPQGVAGGAVLGAAYRALQDRTAAAAVTGGERVSVSNGAVEVVAHV